MTPAIIIIANNKQTMIITSNFKIMIKIMIHALTMISNTK